MTHITTFDKTPRELGYRMAAEWETQTSVWLQWPYKHPAATTANDYPICHGFNFPCFLIGSCL